MVKLRAKTFAVFFLLVGAGQTTELPDGYWRADRSQAILDATLRIRLDSDLSHLSDAEQRALRPLLAAGQILHDLYEDQLHAQALASRKQLHELLTSTVNTVDINNLRDLYRLSNGPIVTTLENQREAFLPVQPEALGRNVYPAEIARSELDDYLSAHTDQLATLLAERTIVRRATAENLQHDLAQLDRYPAVEALQPKLRQRLENARTAAVSFYAVPYSLAYAPQLAEVRLHLETAADILAADSADFSAYLRNRSRDLLSGNYESGDAAWVSGSFGNVNAQIGSYETYNDSLYGVKAFYSASILVRDEEKSRALEAAIAELQSIEDSLPYEHSKRVRSKIPVGVYNVVADFGQARGANTATILPNNADHTRKYGRTILIRNNIITNSEIFAIRKKRFDAVMSESVRDHLSMEGGFARTLWHEVGHYLGVSVAVDGRSLDEALAEDSDLFEEMKSDLVSLYAAPALHELGFHDEASLRAHYADGIRRTLQVVKPRATQPYQNMQLMQFNFFLEADLIELDANSALLDIHYDRYHEVVTELLKQVLQIQYAGDATQAKEFVKRWAYWDEDLHGQLAIRMQQSATFRNVLVTYDALGE